MSGQNPFYGNQGQQNFNPNNSFINNSQNLQNLSNNNSPNFNNLQQAAFQNVYHSPLLQQGNLPSNPSGPSLGGPINIGRPPMQMGSQYPINQGSMPNIPNLQTLDPAMQRRLKAALLARQQQNATIALQRTNSQGNGSQNNILNNQQQYAAQMTAQMQNLQNLNSGALGRSASGNMPGNNRAGAIINPSLAQTPSTGQSQSHSPSVLQQPTMPQPTLNLEGFNSTPVGSRERVPPYTYTTQYPSSSPINNRPTAMSPPNNRPSLPQMRTPLQTASPLQPSLMPLSPRSKMRLDQEAAAGVAQNSVTFPTASVSGRPISSTPVLPPPPPPPASSATSAPSASPSMPAPSPPSLPSASSTPAAPSPPSFASAPSISSPAQSPAPATVPSLPPAPTTPAQPQNPPRPVFKPFEPSKKPEIKPSVTFAGQPARPAEATRTETPPATRAPAREEASQPAIERKKGGLGEGARGSMRNEIARLMYACGDVPEPDIDSVDFMEDMVVEFLADLCQPVPPIRSGPSAPFVPPPLTSSIIRHRLHKPHFRKYLERFDHMLSMTAEIEQAKRVNEPSNEDLVKTVGSAYLGLGDDEKNKLGKKGRPKRPREEGDGVVRERKKPGPKKGFKSQNTGVSRATGVNRGSAFKRRGISREGSGSAGPAAIKVDRL